MLVGGNQQFLEAMMMSIFASKGSDEPSPGYQAWPGNNRWGQGGVDAERKDSEGVLLIYGSHTLPETNILAPKNG